MEAKERIVVALDVATIEKAKELAIQLHPYVGAFKIGLELITSEGGPEVIRHIDDVCGRYYFAGKWEGNPSQIFYDGKFNDIPNTVAGAARAVTRLGVKMFNIHCLGGVEMMSAAKKAAEEEASLRKTPRPLILGVTLLTSLDYQALEELDVAPGWYDRSLKEEMIQRMVRGLALAAQKVGLDGVIASPQEIKMLRQWCQPEFLIVTPGIRPLWAAAGDQKRIDTPSAAIKAGADYLVIGRPITQPPKEIGGPIEAVKKIIEEIEVVV